MHYLPALLLSAAAGAVPAMWAGYALAAGHTAAGATAAVLAYMVAVAYWLRARRGGRNG